MKGSRRLRLKLTKIKKQRQRRPKKQPKRRFANHNNLKNILTNWYPLNYLKVKRLPNMYILLKLRELCFHKNLLSSTRNIRTRSMVRTNLMTKQGMRGSCVRCLFLIQTIKMTMKKANQEVIDRSLARMIATQMNLERSKMKVCGQSTVVDIICFIVSMASSSQSASMITPRQLLAASICSTTQLTTSCHQEISVL